MWSHFITWFFTTLPTEHMVVEFGCSGWISSHLQRFQYIQFIHPQCTSLDNSSEKLKSFNFSDVTHLCWSKVSIKSFKACLGVFCRQRSRISCLAAVSKSCADVLQAISCSIMQVSFKSKWLTVQSAQASDLTALMMFLLQLERRLHGTAGRNKPLLLLSHNSPDENELWILSAVTSLYLGLTVKCPKPGATQNWILSVYCNKLVWTGKEEIEKKE